MTYTLEQAQTNLAQILDEAESGQEIVIERAEKPDIHLVVVKTPSFVGQRIPGQYAGQVSYPDDFFKPLETDEELREYGFDILVDENPDQHPL